MTRAETVAVRRKLNTYAQRILKLIAYVREDCAADSVIVTQKVQESWDRLHDARIALQLAAKAVDDLHVQAATAETLA